MIKVTMFTSKTWPHCHTAKEYLSSRCIIYEEKDVNENPAARAEFQRLKLNGVPAFKIKDEIVVGLDKQKIESLLDYTFTSCEKCNAKMRIPKNKGKIRITCSSCSHQFITTT